MDKGYVLHSYQYRETSLILQVWTEKHGRLGLVAKGARRPKSASRAVLVPFQLLSMSWFGRGELRTLKAAEPASPATPLGGASLLSAFYLNELLLKLTTRDDPHEQLFAAYDEAILSLRSISREIVTRPRGPAPLRRACCRNSATRSSSRASRAPMRRSPPRRSTCTWSNAARSALEEARRRGMQRLRGPPDDLERGLLGTRPGRSQAAHATAHQPLLNVGARHPRAMVRPPTPRTVCDRMNVNIDTWRPSPGAAHESPTRCGPVERTWAAPTASPSTCARTAAIQDEDVRRLRHHPTSS
jgi:hypothetical protein